MAQTSGFLDLFTNPAPLTARELFARSMANASDRMQAVIGPEYALSREQNIYELLRRDAAFDHAITLMLHGVAGTASMCVPREKPKADKGGKSSGGPKPAGGDRGDAEFDADGADGGDGSGDSDAADPYAMAATVGTQFLERIDRLDEAKTTLATAVVFGSSFAVVKGRRETHDWGDGVEREWWVCTRLADVDRRRVRYQRPVGVAGGDPFTLHYFDVSPGSDHAWKPVQHPEWVLQCVHEDRDATLKSGRGLVDSLFVYWYGKANLFQWMLQAAEAWGKGRIVVKVDAERAGSTAQDNATLIQNSIDNVDASRAGHTLGCLTTEEIEMLNSDAGGFTMIREALGYIDEAVLRLCLGASLPFGGGGESSGKSAGSLARSNDEMDVSQALQVSRRRMLESEFERKLLPLFWRLNRRNLGELGIESSNFAPRVAFTKEAEEDPAVFATTVKTLLDAGISLPSAYVYERLGIPPPEGAPDVLAPMPKPDAFGGGGFGGGGGDTKPESRPEPDAQSRDDEPAIRPALAAALNGHAARFDAMAERIDSLADREAPQWKPPPVHVEVNIPPLQPTPVHVDAPNVTVEAAKAPDVHVDSHVAVAPSPAPNVTVEAAKAPTVRVEAPTVNVTTPPASVVVEAPKPRKRRTKVNRGADGEITSTETVEE